MYLDDVLVYSKIKKEHLAIDEKCFAILWKDEQRKAFEALKEALTTTPVLAVPDLNQPFFVTTDAYGFAKWGALWSNCRMVNDVLSHTCLRNLPRRKLGGRHTNASRLPYSQRVSHGGTTSRALRW